MGNEELQAYLNALVGSITGNTTDELEKWEVDLGTRYVTGLQEFEQSQQQLQALVDQNTQLQQQLQAGTTDLNTRRGKLTGLVESILTLKNTGNDDEVLETLDPTSDATDDVN